MKRFIDQEKARELVEDKKKQAKLKKKLLDVCIKYGYADLNWIDRFVDEYVEFVKKEIVNNENKNSEIENKIDVIKELVALLRKGGD